MPEDTPNENELIDKAGAVLNRQNATAIMNATNAMANAANELVGVLQRAGIEQAAEAAPAEGEEEPVEDEKEVEEKMVVRLTQEETGYTSVSVKKGMACENCRWFYKDYQYNTTGCQIVQNWPLDIVSGGYCDRHELLTPEMVAPTPMPVEIVEQEAKAQKEYTSVIQRVKDTLRKAMKPAGDTPLFHVYKDTDGKMRWFARYTNNAEDREGDIFSEAAHDDYIARVNTGLIPMPELWMWHKKGTKHGQATRIERDGHIVMAVGTFDDTPFAEKCIRFYRKSRGRIKLSHGSLVPKWARKVVKETGGRLFTAYNTVEITTLPPMLAVPAALFTTFEEEIPMALTKEQKEFFVKEFGEDEAARIERENETINKTIEDLLVYKDFADLKGDKEKPVESAGDKVAASLLAKMIDDHALVIKIAEGVAKHQAAVDAKIEAIEKQHADDLKTANDTIAALQATVQKFVGATPRRASADPKTVLSDEQAAQVQKEIPTETDDFFGGLGVPKKA